LTFTDASLLWLGGALTALILLGVWSHGRRRRKLAEFIGGHRALARVSRSDLSGLRVGRSLLLGLAGICLAIAAAEPTWVEPPAPEPPPVDRLVLALDVSASMQATDVPPTRLARAVDVARELLAAAEGQEVGLLVFAGIGYPIAPPTLDHDALAFMLDGITPTMASAYDPGTLGAIAVQEAVALIEAGTDSTTRIGRRRVVVISDGDDGETEAALLAAVDSARTLGVDVYAIGVGTARGSGMSMPGGAYQLGGPVTTASGARASSRLDEGRLRALAARGGGRYAHADAGLDVAALRAELTAPPPPTPLPGGEGRPAWARYDLTLVLGVAALVLALLESLLDASLPRLPALRTRRVA
jgi:Ca-activated chloride channel family protein